MDWHFLIPISWALVSAGLALVLYRTSNGLFEQSKRDEKQVQRIRLGGSVVVAGAIFFSLKWATPPESIKPLPKDAVVISRKALSSLTDAISGAKNSLDRLQACAQISPPQECRAEQEILKNAINNISKPISAVE